MMTTDTYSTHYAIVNVRIVKGNRNFKNWKWRGTVKREVIYTNIDPLRVQKEWDGACAREKIMDDGSILQVQFEMLDFRFSRWMERLRVELYDCEVYVDKEVIRVPLLQYKKSVGDMDWTLDK
jgi:hypothetical protein